MEHVELIKHYWNDDGNAPIAIDSGHPLFLSQLCATVGCIGLDDGTPFAVEVLPETGKYLIRPIPEETQ